MPIQEFHFQEDEVRAACSRLRGIAYRTPLLPSQRIQGLHFKAENLQRTGSFKIRPAYNQVALLSDRERSRGIVTSSSGNFAQGAAYAALAAGACIKIVMMRGSNPLKVEGTRELGGEVVLCEDRFEARDEAVARIAAQEGRTVIHPFDHPGAIYGNSTIGAEILEQGADLKRVVVPISGGGLLAGVAAAIRHARPEIGIFGAQPTGSNAAVLSLRAGHPVRIDKAETMADGIRVTRPGDWTFSCLRRWVDDIVEVSEDSILEAVRHHQQFEKLVVEPSGAVTLAAVLEGKIPAEGTAAVISGGNIDPRVQRLVHCRPIA